MMEKKKIVKVLKGVLEVLVLLALIAIIVYLIKSDNGILGKLNQKKANEKLNDTIKEFVSSEDGRDLEEYIKEIDGLEKMEVNREEGTIELIIDGQELFVVVEALGK